MAAVSSLGTLALLLAFAAAPEQTTVQVGEDAPNFAAAVLNGKQLKIPRFSLAAQLETKRVVLTFGASYCEPCKKELAELKALEPKLAAAGVQLAVIIIDTDPEGVEAMRKLTIDQLQLPYPVIVDSTGFLAKRWRAYTLPFTVVVEKNGKVSFAQSGFKEGSIEKLMKHVGG